MPGTFTWPRSRCVNTGMVFLLDFADDCHHLVAHGTSATLAVPWHLFVSKARTSRDFIASSDRDAFTGSIHDTKVVSLWRLKDFRSTRKAFSPMFSRMIPLAVPPCSTTKIVAPFSAALSEAAWTTGQGFLPFPIAAIFITFQIPGEGPTETAIQCWFFGGGAPVTVTWNQLPKRARLGL